MSASKVLQEEGGSPEDIAPTHKMLRKNLTLGWPHFMFNEETERYNLLYVRKQHAEVFNQCWRANQEGTLNAACSRSSVATEVKHKESSAATTLNVK